MIIATVSILAMICVSLWANSRFKAHDRLPMQWSLTGKVTWTAPRPFALAFYPSLTVIIVIAMSILSNHLTPRLGQEEEAAYAIPALGILFFVIQCGHLFMTNRTFRSA
jgi:hypothetical protein